MIRPCRSLILLSLLTVSAILAAAAPAPAAVPRAIAFQGFLTDAAAQPLQGTVSLVLSIYGAATGSSPLWTETQASVAVSDGVFAVTLGNATPFPADLFISPTRFLGIRVNGEAELPRTQLRSTPYARSADWADEAASASTVTERILIANGEQAALVTFIDANSRRFVAYGVNGGAKADIGSVADYGELTLRGGNTAVMVALSAFGGAGALNLMGNGPNSNWIELDTSLAPGNSSVRLPADAISASEMQNEPGVASANNTGIVALTATVASVLSRTITPPGSGYVLAFGQCVARINHTNGTGTSGAVGLSDDGVAFGTAQDVNLQISANAGSGSYSLPAHFNGVFQATAGTPMTIYLVGSEASGVIDIEDTSLTLLYVPTAYGSVSQTLLAASDGEDLPARGAQTPGELLAEKLASQEANTARLEQELATMRSEYAERLARVEDRLEQAGGQR